MDWFQSISCFFNWPGLINNSTCLHWPHQSTRVPPRLCLCRKWRLRCQPSSWWLFGCCNASKRRAKQVSWGITSATITLTGSPKRCNCPRGYVLTSSTLLLTIKITWNLYWFIFDKQIDQMQIYNIVKNFIVFYKSASSAVDTRIVLNIVSIIYIFTSSP